MYTYTHKLEISLIKSMSLINKLFNHLKNKNMKRKFLKTIVRIKIVIKQIKRLSSA